MARCILLVDSATGELIDVAGNGREGGRYKRFVKRFLSRDPNPVLDYGCNGGDTLNVSKGGGKGKAINLKAETVNVSDALTVGGRPLAAIVAEQAAHVLDNLSGASGQITVRESTVVDPETGESRNVTLIALHDTITGKLEMIENALSTIKDFVSKSALAQVVQDLQVKDTDTIEEVKGTLRVLLARMAALSGQNAPDQGS